VHAAKTASPFPNPASTASCVSLAWVMEGASVEDVATPICNLCFCALMPALESGAQSGSSLHSKEPWGVVDVCPRSPVNACLHPPFPNTRESFACDQVGA